MKLAIAFLATLTAAGFGVPFLTSIEGVKYDQQEERRPQTDTDSLYVLVQQARNELRALRQTAGLHAHPPGPHVDPSSHHEGENAADRERERKERDGHEDRSRREGQKWNRGESKEHGERGHREGRESAEHERGEEGKSRIPKLEKHVKTYKNGAHLTLQYNPATEAFVGRVQNTLKVPLTQIRVEIHLSNGLELGPTKRTDLQPGATLPVELSALDQKFTYWVTHPEAGSEEAHGPAEEENEGHAGREARSEHGFGRGRHEEKGEQKESRPSTADLRPLYNQLQLLRGEIRSLSKAIEAKKQQKL